MDFQAFYKTLTTPLRFAIWSAAEVGVRDLHLTHVARPFFQLLSKMGEPLDVKLLRIDMVSHAAFRRETAGSSPGLGDLICSQEALEINGGFGNSEPSMSKIACVIGLFQEGEDAGGTLWDAVCIIVQPFIMQL
ncbi:hypothetical protein RQP46_002179 [Phenoliferia psychrophenolica]